MKCFRLLVLVLCALSLGAGQAFAAEPREERAFAAATAAFQDGLWGRAEAEFAQFVQRYPKSERLAEAVFYQAQAQLRQAKYPAVLNLLAGTRVKPGDFADRYLYLQGKAQLELGSNELAVATFASLEKRFPQSPLRLTAAVESAAALDRLGDWPRVTALIAATNSIFVRLAEQDPANELISRGRLILSKAYCEQGKFSEALAVLSQLNAATLPPDLGWQCANLLCRVQLGAGDLEGALVTVTNLLQLGRSQDAARQAEAVSWQGTILERLNRWADAQAVWSQNLAGTAPVERQREAVLKVAGTALAQKDFAGAGAALEKFLAQFPVSPAAELALLTLGELQLKDYLANPESANQLARARVSFERLLASSAKSPLAGKAYLNRGWCNWFATNLTAALADFRSAEQQLPVSSDQALARFKAGDVLFALKDFKGARTNYQAVLTQFDDISAVIKTLGDRSLYQILRADLELKDLAGAETAMRQLLERFPESDLADQSLLLLGEGLSDSGATDNALNVFKEFERQYPGSPLLPQVELARARAFERAQDWPAAVTNYTRWLKTYLTNELRPQVEYSLGHASYQAGDETTALTAFTNFVEHYPASGLAPLAQWWVADHYFRLGGANFSEAERNYELVFQNTNSVWRNSSLYFPAQLMAGRAAAARLGFPDAVNYLTKLIADTNCPPPLATQAMFAYGSVLMRMDSPDTNRPFANFELATNVFMQISIANPTNVAGPLAASEFGDCCLQLGALDAATNAYVQVMNSPYASAVLRSRAQVGVGRVLEKKAELLAVAARKPLLDQALKNYLDVFETSYGRGLNDGEAPSAFWVKKAGLLALPLLSVENCPTNFFNRLQTLLPALTETLNKKRAALGVAKE